MDSQLFSRKHYLLALLAGTVLLWPNLAGASALCGSVIGPVDYFSPTTPTYSTAISDCTNPFGATNSPSPFQFRLLGQVVGSGTEFDIPETGTADYEFRQLRPLFDARHAFYRHEDGDLVFVGMWPAPPSEADARAFAQGYFAPAIDIEPYILAWLGESYDPDEIDFGQFDNFNSAFYTSYVPANPLLTPGTYTLLSEEIIITLGRQPLREQIRSWFIPTAYAQYIPPRQLFTLTFTLKAEAPALAGASNLLFIPGLMGTRLYEESALCESGGVRERERWFSRDDCNQRRLQTNFLGRSINELYTKPGVASILDEAGAGIINFNIYKSFLADLSSAKQTGLINDFGVLPYDWRLSLSDLMTVYLDETTGKLMVSNGLPLENSYLYQMVLDLASTSDSGRVTVVAHSNGGLLMKYFLRQLELRNDPLVGKIDNLILVAVPQAGTPEAVLGVLHGTELSFVMKQPLTRFLMNTLPSAHHLLPGEDYFWSDRGGVRTPVIEFEPGSATDAWRAQFGTSISSWSSLRNFLSKDSARVAPSEADLATPQILDNFLLNYAQSTGFALSLWQPPASLKVYQIAGTGLPTPSGLTYFTDRACVRRSFFRCTEYADKLGYRVNLVMDGDETVLNPSALLMSESEQVERWWLNIKSANEGQLVNRKHRDLMEIKDLRDFVIAVAASTSRSTQYIFSEPVTFETDQLIFQLHSPLDLSVQLSDGVVVSSSSPSERNVQYRRFGELQYLVVPSEESDYMVELVGEAEGSFTLEVEQYSAGSVVERRAFQAIPSMLGSRASLMIDNPATLLTSELRLAVDYDGDGVVDAEYNEEGLIETEPIVHSYASLRQLIKSWLLPPARSVVLLTLLEVAEKLGAKAELRPQLKVAERTALRVLEAKLRQYRDWRWITSEQFEEARVIINNLIK